MKKDITEQALRIVRAKKKKNQDLFNEKISVLEKDKEFVKIEKEYIGTMNACLTGFLLGSENITILPKEEQLEGV